MFKKIKELIFCKRKQNCSERLPTKRPRDWLLCEICKEVMVCSRTLPCGDSFCEICVNEHFLSNSVHSK